MARGHYIYSIRNLKNNRRYIGTTGDIDQRLGQHKSRLRGNRHHCVALQDDWNTYGEDAFEMTIIEHLHPSKSRAGRERYWIEKFEKDSITYNTDKPGAERPQNRHLESYTKLPDTHRATKAFRFTLPVELANRLESLTKEQRDALLERALRLG